MSEYVIPREFYFRIHHVRPRFKGDIENVLIYMAEEITKIGELPTDDFVRAVNSAIYRYPGNARRELKTINNWRTEISALFGFIEHTDRTDKPGFRAIELAKNQDLVECFKTFLYNFQYPGAHVKPQSALEMINNGIHFKPTQYILKVLKYANRNGGNTVGITKFEACHCIFNDLRVTRDNEGAYKTWARIAANRQEDTSYDQTGDIVRYVGDIIDYMETANLLKTYDSRMYYLNTLEGESLVKFCESTEWFSLYDNMIKRRAGSLQAVKDCTSDWFSYVNRKLEDTDFSTDILSYIAINEHTLTERDKILEGRISNKVDDLMMKDIGNIGESLVHSHECMRIKLGGRSDLFHLIKRMPTSLAVGYDISSVELDERKRYIEVKTTISSKPLHFSRIHLTRNEWNTANSMHDRYYVYRLMISKTKKVLFLLQDPVGLYKTDQINMVPSDGADITFDPKKVGEFEELLQWQT